MVYSIGMKMWPKMKVYTVKLKLGQNNSQLCYDENLTKNHSL